MSETPEKRFLVIAGDFAPVKDNLSEDIDDADSAAAEFASKLGEEFHVYERVRVYRPKTVEIERIDVSAKTDDAASETITGVIDDASSE